MRKPADLRAGDRYRMGDPRCHGRSPAMSVYADGIMHPVVLRVRSQERDVIHANDGSLREMSYRVIPISKAPPEWLGRR
jgi:hypothetical protein